MSALIAASIVPLSFEIETICLASRKQSIQIFIFILLQVEKQWEKAGLQTFENLKHKTVIWDLNEAELSH